MFPFNDPAVLACVGTFGTALLIKSTEYFLSKEKSPVGASISATQVDTNPNDAMNCTAYETRMTQDKLVQAGIIEVTEMFTCDNKDCENCKPTRVAIRRDQRLELEAKQSLDRKAREINQKAHKWARYHKANTYNERYDEWYDSNVKCRCCG